MTLDMQFGNYTLIEEIGSGGFGTVYKAEDNIGRIVAIKVLKPSYGGDPATIERFRREAQAAGDLFHENIATIIEFGETEGRFYLVMRYVDGLPLNSLIDREGRLPWNQALKIIQDIGAALEYAHKRGFVHRDIKPANILVSETEGAVLTDFGLVRAAEAIGLTSTGVTMGTPNYIAPEIWEGEDVSSATDVYSLACVMFEMLTGTKLFDGETTPKIMKQHVMEGPQLPDQWSEDIPVNLNAILRKGLADDRTQRYDQVSDFVSALKTGTISKESSDAPRQTPKPQRKSALKAEKPKKRSRTFRWMFGCGVLGILILVGAGVVLMRSVFRTVEPTSVVVAVKETSTDIPKTPTRTPVPSATPKPSATATVVEYTPPVEPSATEMPSATEAPSTTPTLVPSSTFTSAPEAVGDPFEIPGIPISVGQVIEDVVDEDTNPRDVYRVELVAGEEYLIEFSCLENCGYSVDLVIANPDSKSIEYDRWSKSIEMHSASSIPARSYFAPAVTGNYYIIINADNPNHQYSLSINRTSSDIDPNNVGEIPGVPLAIDQELIGVVDVETNLLDIFAVDLTAGEEYIIDFGCLNSCGYSVDLVIANPDSKSIEFDQWSKSIEMHSASSTPTRSYFAPAVTGKYYIIISADNPNHKYSLRLSRNNVEIYPGQVSEIPGMPVALGEDIIGVVDTETNPLDVFSVDFKADIEYVIDFACLNNCGYSVDLFIANPGSTSFEFDQWSKSIEMHSASSTPTREFFTPAVAGTYYIAISADNPNHKYSLSINEVP